MSKAKAAKTAAVEDELNVEIPEVDFTPAQDAALDAAAKGDPDVVVEVATDPDAEDTTAQPTAEETIANLTKQLAEEKTAREALERDRKANEVNKVKAVEEAETAEQQRFTLAEGKLASDKDIAQRELVDAKRAYKDAYESGDADKVVEANDKLFEAQTKVKVLADNELGLNRFKEQRQQFWKDAKDKTVKQAQSGDAVELNREDFTEAAWNWIGKHPEFRQDKKFHDKAVRAHYAARGEGIEEDTPQYFEFIEKRLGLLQDEDAPTEEEIASEAAAKGEVVVAKKPEPKKSVQTSAPVNRGGETRTASKTDARFKKLSAAEVDAANLAGMKPEEYWDSKNLPADEFVAKYGYPNN